MIRRCFAFLLVPALVAVLAACGSGGNDSDSAAKQDSAEHDHSGHSHGEDAADGSDHSEHSDAAEVPAKPLALRADGLIDPDRVDLGGIEGVTEKQRETSEKLLVDTINVLPKWSDVEQAKADGFESIGDWVTGEEHFMHWDWIEDDTIFDPEHPESLVYKVNRATGERTLEAAMYILPKEYNLENEHWLASPMLQFHIHDNLCFTPPPAPQVRGLTKADGTCGTFGETQLVKFNPNPMVHVWILPNECGPFAALQGVGAGQTANGERDCDHQHGRLSL
jgi:hypothetical protein